MQKDSGYWVNILELSAHPEGGYFKEIYRAKSAIPQSVLPPGFNGDRPYATSIYYLLDKGNFSAMHRIPSDEIWHFYTGDSLVVHVIHQDGRHEEIYLGSNPEKGECFQAVVPAGAWFGSCLADGAAFALLGCTVAPGFHFDDFEMAERAELIAQYPQHEYIIKRLTRH